MLLMRQTVCGHKCSYCEASCSLWRKAPSRQTEHKCLFHALFDEKPLLSPQNAFEAWKGLLESNSGWPNRLVAGFMSCADDKSESWLEVKRINRSLGLVVTGLPFNFEPGWQSLVSTRFKIIQFVRCRFREAVGLDVDDPYALPKEQNKDCGDEKATFSMRVLFERCIFEKRVRLRRVRTEYPLEFLECCFQGYFEINSCCIAGLNCHDSLFQQKVYLEDLSINEPPESSQFIKPSAETTAVSKLVADFSEAVFEGGAAFWNVRFRGPVSFKRAEFYEATDFTNPRFQINKPDDDQVYFSMEAAHIQGSVGIRGIPSEGKNTNDRPDGPLWSVFEAEGQNISEKVVQQPPPHSALWINLKHMSIHKDGGLVLQTCNLEKAELVGTNLSRCTFLGVLWPQVRSTYWMWTLRVREWYWPVSKFSKVGQGLYDFWGWCLDKRLLATRHVLDRFTRQRGCIYGLYDHKLIQEKLADEAKRSPSLAQFVSHENQVGNERVKQWREWRHSWALISKAYRDLKKSYEETKDYIYASDFNFGEKEMRRINHEVPLSTRVQLNLFYYISGYGERILRPGLLLLLLWAIGICVFKGAQGTPQTGCNGCYVGPISLGQAIYISGANMALLRPNDLAAGQTVQIIFSLLQAILGPTFGAMLVLAITNKLKR